MIIKSTTYIFKLLPKPFKPLIVRTFVKTRDVLDQVRGGQTKPGAGLIPQVMRA